MNRSIWISLLFLLLLIGCNNEREPTVQNCEISQEIAVSALENSQSNIYLMNIDGTGIVNLTESTNSTDAFGIAYWSPNGCQLAFLSNHDRGEDDREGITTMDIFVINHDGSGMVNITNNDLYNAFGDWSPDGTKIVFVTVIDGNFEIFSSHADGTNLQRLTNNEVTDFSPVWSIDGNKIFFTSSRDGNPEVYSMDADGSNVVRLTENQYTDKEVRVSPDGKYISYISYVDGGYEIHIMNPDGTNKQQITSNGKKNYNHLWSRDGNFIIYFTHSERNGNYGYVNIYDLSENTSSLLIEIEATTPFDQIISQDGRLLFQERGTTSYYLVDLAGTMLKPVDFQLDRVFHYALKP